MKCRRIVAALMISLTGMCVSGLSHATVTKSDLNQNSGSTVYIGFDPADNFQWIVWKNNSTGACGWSKIGDSEGLTDDVIVDAMGGADIVTVVNSGSVSVCFATIQPLRYGGRYLDIRGGSGFNQLYGGSGDTWLFGGNDGNYMHSSSAAPSINGGNGNDTILASGAGSGGSFTAGGGNDCMGVNSLASPDLMTCGDGTDSWGGPGTRPDDCEITEFCCGIC